MMTNLFSMFDPSTQILNLPLNWLSLLISMSLIPMIFWMIPNNYMILYYKIMMILFNEFKIIIKNKTLNKSIIIFISLFIMIMLNNIMGLFPYIFTSTSHLLLNLSLALPFWMSFLIYGWLNKMNHMFIHLVPQGTPSMLIPFMVCIETISNMIRPITLTVRLTANIIAGHLLLTLLGNMSPILSLLFIPILLFIQILLLTLESAVAIIQAYVFSILMILYISEV